MPLRLIDRPALRQRIISVLQEAVFLPDGATFMANLDPSDISTPADCEAVLVAVGLWNFVCQRGGSHAGMIAGTRSAGQRQLFSVGRALLRQRTRTRLNNSEGGVAGSAIGGILLLDEVSSSVDQDTERVIREIIKAEFARYTVIAVTHRLDMIMDFDHVLVMDCGEVVEVGAPVVLAGEASSRFTDSLRVGGK